jgi:hypothetical protein
LDPPYGLLDKEWDLIDFRTLQYFGFTAAAALMKKHCCVAFNQWQVCRGSAAVRGACNATHTHPQDTPLAGALVKPTDVNGSKKDRAGTDDEHLSVPGSVATTQPVRTPPFQSPT